MSAWYPLTAASEARPAVISDVLGIGEPNRPFTAHAAAAALAALDPMPEPRGNPWGGGGGRGWGERHQVYNRDEAKVGGMMWVIHTARVVWSRGPAVSAPCLLWVSSPPLAPSTPPCC